MTLWWGLSDNEPLKVKPETALMPFLYAGYFFGGMTFQKRDQSFSPGMTVIRNGDDSDSDNSKGR